jgi:predicted lipase
VQLVREQSVVVLAFDFSDVLGLPVVIEELPEVGTRYCLRGRCRSETNSFFRDFDCVAQLSNIGLGQGFLCCDPARSLVERITDDNLTNMF